MPCVACGSLRGWQVCYGISGNFAVECAASLLWNQWQVLRGISGNFRMEWVATFARNTHWLASIESPRLAARARAVQRQRNGAHNGHAPAAAPVRVSRQRASTVRGISDPRRALCAVCPVFDAKGDQTICTPCRRQRWEHEGHQASAQEAAPVPWRQPPRQRLLPVRRP